MGLHSRSGDHRSVFDPNRLPSTGQWKKIGSAQPKYEWC